MNPVLMPNTPLQNRYQIIQLLGQGGMGAVYLAHDLRLQGLKVAIKENFDNSPAAQAQFQTEAAILARLSHPALPRVTDYFIEPSGRQYLVMDYVAGQDLEQLVNQRGRIAEDQAVRWMTQILGALEYLHSQTPPIIHRDIKPANIKIRPDGRAVLVDFGIAKVYDPTRKTQPGARAVTPGYAPLEQYGYGQTDARSDLYALGATLYFLLVGQPPPEATDLAAGLQSLRLPSAQGVVVSTKVEQALARALALDAQQRFQSAHEFRLALSSPASSPSTVPSHVSPSAVTLMPTATANPQVAPVALPQSQRMPPPAAAPIPVSAPVTTGLVYASWGRRAVAYLIDTVLLYLVNLPFSILALILDMAFGSSYSSSSSTGVFSTLWGCAWYLWVPTYFVLCHTIGGQTLGKKALGIRVVRLANNRPPELGWSILRSLVHGIESFFALFLVGFIGFLWPLWDPQKQALHDKLAGTIVIRV